MLKRLLFCALLAAPATNAQAAPVLQTGTTFQFTISPAISGTTSGFGTVRPNTGPNGTRASGAELDGCIAGCGTSIDFGFGPDGDQFVFAISAFGNIAQPRNTVTFSLASLDFVGGPAPFNIEILSSSYANAQVTSLTDSSFSVSFSGEPFVNPGSIVGRFAETSPVPLPAAGTLLLGALGGIAALRRRRA